MSDQQTGLIMRKSDGFEDQTNGMSKRHTRDHWNNIVHALPKKNVITNWRGQEFAKGGQTRGSGTEVPQRGPGAEPRWGSGGEEPETHMLNIRLNNATDRHKLHTV